MGWVVKTSEKKQTKNYWMLCLKIIEFYVSLAASGFTVHYLVLSYKLATSYTHTPGSQDKSMKLISQYYST